MRYYLCARIPACPSRRTWGLLWLAGALASQPGCAEPDGLDTATGNGLAAGSKAKSVCGTTEYHPNRLYVWLISRQPLHREAVDNPVFATAWAVGSDVDMPTHASRLCLEQGRALDEDMLPDGTHSLDDGRRFMAGPWLRVRLASKPKPGNDPGKLLADTRRLSSLLQRAADSAANPLTLSSGTFVVEYASALRTVLIVELRGDVAIDPVDGMGRDGLLECRFRDRQWRTSLSSSAP